jgi:tRNA(Ile)-lysidine synthase TilS/MesJ
MIRPLIYAPEKIIRSAVKRSGLPVVKSKCPVDGATAREATKKWLAEMEKGEIPGLSKKIHGAIKRAHLSGW